MWCNYQQLWEKIVHRVYVTLRSRIPLVFSVLLKGLLMENSPAGVPMRPYGSLQVPSTCWHRVCVLVIGLQPKCTFSTNRLLWLSGSVTGQQDGRPGRGEAIGAPHEQSAPSRDSALAKNPCLRCFPRSYRAAKSAALVLSTFLRKRRRWWLQHCLRCGGDRMFTLACLGAFSIHVLSCLPTVTQGLSSIK